MILMSHVLLSCVVAIDSLLSYLSISLYAQDITPRETVVHAKCARQDTIPRQLKFLQAVALHKFRQDFIQRQRLQRMSIHSFFVAWAGRVLLGQSTKAPVSLVQLARTPLEQGGFVYPARQDTIPK
jgi:hypothetical protein